MTSNSTKNIGQKGEDLAVEFLMKLGHQIIERNYRYKRGEIDIVSVGDKRLCFVEVKMRKRGNFGNPEEFVAKGQQERIIEVADYYIEKIDWKGDIRFDILAISEHKGRTSIEYFKDAFY